MVSRGRCNPDFGQILRFSNGKVANSTLMNSFYKKIYGSKANFEAPKSTEAEKIKLLQVWRFKKCETDPLGVFSAKIFEYWGRKGGPKSKFWGQHQKISKNLGPKMLITIFPTSSNYSRGLRTPFLINFRGVRSILAKNRLKIVPKIASSVAL